MENTNTNTTVDVNTNAAATDGEAGAEVKENYTKAEVDALLQKEADRRVSEALKKAERKNAEKVKEAEKLAKMNEEQRYQYELEQRENSLKEKEKKLALYENRNEASKILSEKHISLSLVDFVLAEDAETMMDNINTLEKEFKASVGEEVERRLKSNTPKANLSDGAMTREQFRNLSMSKQVQLMESNPEFEKFLK